MPDEGLHEIQLNGKQLVFLFMAATVVAVVIFLCGVMVGRGVPTELAESAAEIPEQTSLDPTAARALSSSAVGIGTAPSAGGEVLTYPSRLEDPNPPAETLKPAAEADALAAPAPVALAAPPVKPAPPPAPVAPRAALPAPPPAKPARATSPVPAAAPPAPTPRPTPAVATAATSPGEPAGSGFVVQVAAVRQRAEAETMARRLGAKGYPAFVTTAGANFRVRVGKYDNRREAEAVAGRLEREEQFKPWITR